MVWTASLPQELSVIAKEILEKFPQQRIFTLQGQLGAGKTTLVKAFAQELNVHEPVSSPSFSLIQEYRGNNSQTAITHIDLYRLNRPEEIEDIGLLDYLEQSGYCFIEWPEIVEQLLEQYDPVGIVIDVLEDTSRKIRIFRKEPATEKS